MISIDAEQKAKLMNDLRMVIEDAQEILRMTADQVGDSAVGVRARVEARLAEATRDLRDLQEAAATRVKAAGDAADEFVQENPWKSIGIAAGIGLVVGLLIARR
jgi:ElaB/YqjD/DUF883 family membrane-anchored ribosome-binding protein